MSKKGGRFGKYGEIKRNEKIKKSKNSIVKLEKHFKIAPGRPNSGRR